MSLVLADRVKETCNSPGTGTVSLLGAQTGYQTFSSAIGNANTCYYTIADQVGSNWEVGLGTYASSGNTLARTTILSSSNGGSATNFSSGVQDVFVTYPAEKAVYLSSSGNVSALGTVTSGVWNGTAIANSYLANSTIKVNGTTLTLGDTGDTITANTPNSLTFNNGGSGATSGTAFNGGSAYTISYNTIGASPTAGSTSLTTLGTITTGTWNGSTIGTGYGGTGLTSFTSNGVVYASSSSALTTGSSLVFDGTKLMVGGGPNNGQTYNIGAYKGSSHVAFLINSDNGYNAYTNFSGYGGGISFGRNGGNGYFEWHSANDFGGTTIGTLDTSGNLSVAGYITSTGIYETRSQFVGSGGNTYTFTTLSNVSSNQSYLITVRQSGSATNNVLGVIYAYGSSAKAYNVVQDNTNPVLLMTLGSSGLDITLTLGSGFGSTTWDWVLTRLG